VRLAQEKTVEYIERTEIAGNTVTTNNKEQSTMENQVEVLSNLTVTVPMKTVMDALSKDEAFIDVIYGQMKESISDDVESLISDSLTDNVETVIEEKMSGFLTEDNIWDTIERDVNDAINDAQESEVTQEWIESQLDSYQGQNPENLCSLGKTVWNAICHTVGTDIQLHLNKIQAGDVNLKMLHGLDTMVIDLIKLITTVSENVTKKVIEEEKQKYLANRDEYLEPKTDVVDAHLVDKQEIFGLNPELSVEDMRHFINKLELSDNVKAYVRDAFIKTVNEKRLK